MELLTIVTMLALVEYIVFGAQVGMARGKYNVVAPATTGHELFERVNRIHQNTLEQLIIFIPGLWAFGHFVDPVWGAIIGVPYLAGRILYAISYAKDPATRGTGALLTVISSYTLIVGGLLGAVWALIQS